MNVKMNVMDLQADIKWILNELKDVKDPTLIEKFKTLLKSRKRLKNASSERISIEQYNQELDASIADIKAGNYRTHQDVKGMIGQWGRK